MVAKKCRQSRDDDGDCDGTSEFTSHPILQRARASENEDVVSEKFRERTLPFLVSRESLAKVTVYRVGRNSRRSISRLIEQRDMENNDYKLDQAAIVRYVVNLNNTIDRRYHERIGIT